jgi:hypothetical protein
MGQEKGQRLEGKKAHERACAPAADGRKRGHRLRLMHYISEPPVRKSPWRRIV